MLKKIFYFIFIWIHFSCFSDETHLNYEDHIQPVPLRLTLFSPYTDLDLFSGEYRIMQKSYVLLSAIYGESDYLSGFAFSPFILDISKDMTGVQLSLVNYVGGKAKGFQLGLINSSQELYGLQIGVLTNHTNDVYGVQIGLINKADDVKGFQLGFVNIGKNVTGTQLGIVNIADDQTGFSYGALNFLLKTGQTKLSVWYDSSVPLNFSLKTGSRYFYGILEWSIPRIEKLSNKSQIEMIAFPPISPFNIYTESDSYFSIGIGGRIILNPVWTEIEVKWRDLTDKDGKSLDSLQLQYSFLLGTTLQKLYDIFVVASMSSPQISGRGTPNLLYIEKYLPNEHFVYSFGLGLQFLVFGTPNW